MWTQVRATEQQGTVTLELMRYILLMVVNRKKKHGERVIWLVDILLCLIYCVYIINLLNPTGWCRVQSTHDNCRSKQHRFRDFPSIPWLYDSWSSWYGYRWTSHGVIQNPCWGQGDPLSLMILFYIYVPLSHFLLGLCRRWLNSFLFIFYFICRGKILTLQSLNMTRV